MWWLQGATSVGSWAEGGGQPWPSLPGTERVLLVDSGLLGFKGLQIE